MSTAPDGRGLATDDFDEDEIDWDDDNGPDENDVNESAEGGEDADNLSPLEQLADEGSDIFADDDDLGDREDDEDGA